jgi:hypothetical protein
METAESAKLLATSGITAERALRALAGTAEPIVVYEIP